MKILLAGGGTAGHVNPLLAMANELKSRGHEVVVVGTAEGLEAELVPANGFHLNTIPRVPFPRRPNLDALRFPLKFKQAISEARAIICDNHIDIVVGFGGYVSTPCYIAAKRSGIPVAIHEQNARPGLANRLGARWASLIGLTFPQTALHAGQGKTEVVGLPLRPAIMALVKSQNEGKFKDFRRQYAHALGIDPQMRTLLVTGGSLGAQHLNEVMVSALETLPKNIQVIHLTGKGKAGAVLSAVEARGQQNYLVKEYAMNMEQVLACADLVICRSGAGTVAEMTALGLPAVYVPLPIGNGEQKLNAKEVVSVGGAKLIEDKDFNADYVAQVVIPWLNDAEALAKASQAALACGRSDACPRFAEAVLSLREV